ncbi:MAG: YIP1 family protein [Dehalococcoidia bacterium]
MDYRRLSFGEKVKGFLGAPLSTFNNVEGEALGSALKYFTIWVVIYAILRTIVFYTVERRVFQTLWDLLGVSDAAVYRFDPVIFALLAVAGAFASLFISGSWTHLFVRAFGGRKGYGNTIKAFAYGNTPLFLFGWIPFVGMLFPLWALVLNIIGIRQLHEISTGRAIGAVLLGILALMIIVFLVVLFVVLFFVILAAA